MDFVYIMSKAAADVVHTYVTFNGSTHILSDNGTEFKSSLFEIVAKQFGV